ncbi:hypothetical protein [Microlunatus speluncae]|uniref:hypothetical protein n=1 Tax=Microlunatus speluncae TaxID=2594267 RepID=UPI00126675D2|nr:hypothetical protein [Microlunatus speluncae]
MPVPLDEELEPYTVRSKHSVFLGVLCALSSAAAAVCWFSTTVVYNRRAADHTSEDGPYEAFLDQEFVTWWNWAWIFVVAAVVQFVGAVIADAINVHSTRLAYLLHHPITTVAEPEAGRPDESATSDDSEKPPRSGPAEGDKA